MNLRWTVGNQADSAFDAILPLCEIRAIPVFFNNGADFRVAGKECVERGGQHAYVAFRQSEITDAPSLGKSAIQHFGAFEIYFEFWTPVLDFLTESQVDGSRLVDIGADEPVNDELRISIVYFDCNTFAVRDNGKYSCLAHAAGVAQVAVELGFGKADFLSVGIADECQQVAGAAVVGVPCNAAHVLRGPHADRGTDEQDGERQENQCGKYTPEIEAAPDFLEYIGLFGWGFFRFFLPGLGKESPFGLGLRILIEQKSPQGCFLSRAFLCSFFVGAACHAPIRVHSSENFAQ